MKIRSVLAEIGAVEYRAASEAALNQEVVCLTAFDLADGQGPSQELATGVRRLVLCPPPEPGLAPDVPPDAIALVVYQTAIPSNAPAPNATCVVVASPFSEVEVWARYDHTPQQIVAIDAMKGRLFDAFQRTHNVQQFVQRTYNILHMSTIVVDNDGRILASVGEFGAERTDIAEQLRQGYISTDIQRELDSLDLVASARELRYPTASENVGYHENWVTSVVYYKRLELGRYDVYKPDGPFTGFDLELIDYAGALTGIIVDRMRDVATSSNQGASVLSDILDGRFGSTKDATARLAMAGFDVSGAFAMLTVEGERLFASPTYSSHIGRLMKDVFPRGIWVTYRNSFAMILPVEQEKASPKGQSFPYYEALESMTLDNPPLAAVLVNNSLRAFVSEPFLGVLDASAALDECRALAEVAPTDTIVALHWHHRLSAFMSALGAGSRKAIRLACDQRILAARAHDLAHGTEYVATLWAFLNHPGDAVGASEELHVHRNTFFYRLRKARELFSIPLDTGEDMQNALFTITVIRSLPQMLDGEES